MLECFLANQVDNGPLEEIYEKDQEPQPVSFTTSIFNALKDPFKVELSEDEDEDGKKPETPEEKRMRLQAEINC